MLINLYKVYYILSQQAKYMFKQHISLYIWLNNFHEGVFISFDHFDQFLIIASICINVCNTPQLQVNLLQDWVRCDSSCLSSALKIHVMWNWFVHAKWWFSYRSCIFQWASMHPRFKLFHTRRKRPQMKESPFWKQSQIFYFCDQL